MATIAENLQTIADSTSAIKQAIIDKGGTISGDITTWADAISGISGGGSGAAVFFCNCKVVHPRTGATIESYKFTFDLSTPAIWGEIAGTSDLLEMATTSVFQMPNGNTIISISTSNKELSSSTFFPDVDIYVSDQIEVGRTYEFTNG